MKINTSDAGAVSGFYMVSIEVFSSTLAESTITDSFEMGGGIVIHHGTREGLPIFLMDNPHGHEAGYAIWVGEDDDVRH